MTVKELLEKLPQDILTGLSDDLEIGLPNSKLIEQLMAEGKTYISQFLPEYTEDQEKILLPSYVLARLLERKNHLDLAEKYWNRFKEDVLAFQKMLIRDKTSMGTKISVSSAERVFTDDELSRW
ncbi:MAG: hypothetical protein DRP25_05090 [Thermotoga sp.]|nr:MAG: hypothetical protein DRP25_05090 [Thermotoga sp.]